ncbi:MAG: hypothetical protein ACLFU9_04065 [Candidatus Bathyarchaeia archaeon]
MKSAREFVIITLAAFGLCSVFTLGYSVSIPSITPIRVVHYGFPTTWLEARTDTVQPTATQYTILWFELMLNILLTLVISLAIAFIAMRGISHERQADSTV